MFETLTFWHWASIAAALLVFELLIGAEFMLWLAAAAGLSTIVAFVAPGLDWEIQIVLFAIFCLGSLYSWFKFSLGKKLEETDQPHLNQRQKGYVGKVLVLVQAIENGEGKVSINDSQWKVRGEDAKKGSKVKVVGVDGMTLVVETV